MRKNCFYSFLVFIAFLTCLIFKADAQAVQVTAKLDAQTIRIGDQTKLRLIVNQSAKEKVNFPKLADSVTGKVQIVSSKLDTIRDKANPDQLTVSDIITITSFDQGTYTIPAFSFGTSAGVQTSEPLSLVVQTVQVDTTKAIYDIKQPIAVSYGFFDWLKDNMLWVGLGLLVIAIIVGIIIYLKKRPKPVQVIKEVKPALPAHLIAINKLQQLRERKLWQSDAVKAYYSELSDIIREYLENRYVIKTHEKTTDEILTSLRNMDIQNEYREKLRQLLMLSDLVKFAKEKPLPEENELTMESAIDFVTKTQQRPQAPQATEGGNADV